MQKSQATSVAANGHSTTADGFRQLLPLAIGAIGVVYGDIGTSPLYTLRLCFTAGGPLALTPAHIVGVLSLIFWSVMIIVTFKYAMLIMRADNQGQGGILALMALALQKPRSTWAELLKVAGVPRVQAISAAFTPTSEAPTLPTAFWHIRQ